MTSIVFCILFVLASAWMLHAYSSTLLALAYLLALLLVVARALVAWASGRQPSRRGALAVLVGAAPLLWYGLNTFVEPMPQAARHHVAEMLGAVLPGVAIGLLVAISVRDLISVAPPEIRSERLRAIRIGIWLDLACVSAVAMFLAANTADDLLLVSTALLAGAETYQTLGDTLTLNLVVVTTLSLLAGDVATRGGAGARMPGHAPWLCVALAAVTLACAVLVGSNKLLLVSVALLAGILIGAWWEAPVHRRWSVLGGLVGLLLLGAGFVALADIEIPGLAEVLALTRLLDYGNVESIFDTPSISSRVEIFSGCGARQFELAPWTGDLAAEYRTCGDGHYLHSLLSIQSHLGVVGSLLTLAGLSAGFITLWSRERLRHFCLPLLLVVLVALMGAFFTWMPFWFAFTLALSLGASATGPLRRVSAP